MGEPWVPLRLSARHGGQKHDRGVLANRRVEPAQCPHVLAVDVDVHERPDLLAVVDALAEAREIDREVLEQLADGGSAASTSRAPPASSRSTGGTDGTVLIGLQNST